TDVVLELLPELHDEAVHRERRGVPERADGLPEAHRRGRGGALGPGGQRLQGPLPPPPPPPPPGGAGHPPRGLAARGGPAPAHPPPRLAHLAVASSMTMTPPEPAMFWTALRASNSSATSISSAASTGADEPPGMTAFTFRPAGMP